ncbi:hypothetical protein ACMT4L_16270 [Deinococcus sp. A31D244]|uniref:hypothetical protein n=1 Tax=Deinococcus sp. A31D244 TaxID=3397675 RepID=UPI0039E0F6B2
MKLEELKARQVAARKARDPIAAAYTRLIGAADNKLRAQNAPAEEKVIAAVLRADLAGLNERAAQLLTLGRDAEAQAEQAERDLLGALVADLDAGMLSDADLSAEITRLIQGGATNIGAVMQGLKATGRTYDGAAASRLARAQLA